MLNDIRDMLTADERAAEISDEMGARATLLAALASGQVRHADVIRRNLRGQISDARCRRIIEARDRRLTARARAAARVAPPNRHQRRARASGVNPLHIPAAHRGPSSRNANHQ